MKKRFVFVVGFLLVLGLVAYGSLAADTPLRTPSHILDKFQHMGAYGLLMLMALAATRGRSRLALGLGLVAMGVVMELLQGWGTAGREASWLDMLANGVGVALGAWCYQYLRQRFGSSAS